ncbi:hypothetical protein BUALT_Bualt11G0119800 [Buddleja alternifolia]|uniref:Leucine-rich repeat-containing N-terminal plant-type domain-containing protein n=1 Tax=Buddleja alternifolia TaxID=168488 RepID=A0AAV6WUF8_9LAMI|nr:hypothetical protein BUALT_Bualt11G0119800 [Buddleja alternifolia]
MSQTQYHFFFFFISMLLPFFIVSSYVHSQIQCLEDQKTLLLQLKNTLVFDSSLSTKLVKWNKARDCCSWDGIECDSAGHVITLNLEDEAISGVIDNSSSLFGLRYLEKLNLADNKFDGEIQIYNLPHLTHLNLSYAGFGGQVPIELSRMRSLVSLDLSADMTGLKLEYPNNLKMLVQNLTGLRELKLDRVDISAQGSDWCRVISSSLPNLRILSLIDCNLSGPLDPSLLQLYYLSVLQLDGNNLSPSVPDLFANFSSLTTLSLRNCSLQGTFPAMIFQTPTLQNLDLSNNELLSVTVPQFLQSRSLRNMLLRFTNSSGSIPNSISNLSMLSTIDLFYCKFSGSIPSTLSNLTQLTYVSLSQNFFTGSIPLFHLSKKLTSINLRNNRLTGSLSSTHFKGLLNLESIDLGYNLLGGSIPESLFDLPSLQFLRLSNNQFRGRVNEFSIPHSSSMYIIDLSNNHLEGPIPESFFKLEGLGTLSLSYNFFNGTFELENIRRLRNLNKLELSYNNLSVDASTTNCSLSTFPQLYVLELASCNMYNFPDQLRNQSNLLNLDLSRNLIMGELPSWIWEFERLAYLNISFNFLDDIQKPYHVTNSLTVVDLHSNRLRGELLLPLNDVVYVDYSNNNFEMSIPHNIGNFTPYLSFFSLANNSIYGIIPTSFCNSTQLQVLDLSLNNLGGSIPPCLVQNMPSLVVLNLAANNISGDITDTFPINCGLEILDLGNNNLGGKIPLSLANCKSLEVMNVGYNNIHDSFPCMLSSSLRVLLLRSNRFHGELRCQKSWPNLQIIDIASNNFNGNLYPIRFSSWRGMMLGNNSHVLYFLGNSSYYPDKVKLTLKGQELEIVIMTILTSVDFSCNTFQGQIPHEIGDLNSLYIFNLSHNNFTGTIPTSLGKLKQLGSLDLSSNNLTGEIPKELTDLTFLSFLNLSYNKLVGAIPKDHQFQTFSADSYEGNTGLCGFPLSTGCNSQTDEQNGVPGESEKKAGEIEWDYVSAALGYVVGLGSFVWVLLCCPSLRETYFDQIERLFEKIFIRQQRRRRRGRRVVRNEVRRH